MPGNIILPKRWGDIPPTPDFGSVDRTHEDWTELWEWGEDFWSGPYEQNPVLFSVGQDYVGGMYRVARAAFQFWRYGLELPDYLADAISASFRLYINQVLGSDFTMNIMWGSNLGCGTGDPITSADFFYEYFINSMEFLEWKAAAPGLVNIGHPDLLNAIKNAILNELPVNFLMITDDDRNGFSPTEGAPTIRQFGGPAHMYPPALVLEMPGNVRRIVPLRMMREDE